MWFTCGSGQMDVCSLSVNLSLIIIMYTDCIISYFIPLTYFPEYIDKRGSTWLVKNQVGFNDETRMLLICLFGFYNLVFLLMAVECTFVDKGRWVDSALVYKMTVFMMINADRTSVCVTTLVLNSLWNCIVFFFLQYKKSLS